MAYNCGSWSVRVGLQVAAIWRKRWNMFHSPLHAFTYAIDPEFWGHKIEDVSEVMNGVETALTMLLVDAAASKAIAQLSEVWQQHMGRQRKCLHRLPLPAQLQPCQA